MERGSIPAGWYPDQSGADQLRWWDGDAWSSEVRPLVIDMVPDFVSARTSTSRLAPTPERLAPAPNDPNTLTRRQLREMLGGPLTTEMSSGQSRH
ncbi:MAG: DUF2510 domain-containing protein [Salinibacterium sp.]|nr:DUF2510 domain-containing protein [Salinibacterium sp.]